MQTLMLRGQPQTLLPIQSFRSQHRLAGSFGVSLFEPKDYAGLAALNQAGGDLQSLKSAVLNAAAVPSGLQRHALLMHGDHLREVFEAELRRINPRIGLREPEIDFAVAGFGSMCSAWLYELIRAGGQTPDFASVYTQWFNDSVRVSSLEHLYLHSGNQWRIHIINAIYGRLGLEITLEDEQVVYVSDSLYACPAEGFMASLLHEVAQTLASRP